VGIADAILGLGEKMLPSGSPVQLFLCNLSPSLDLSPKCSLILATSTQEESFALLYPLTDSQTPMSLLILENGNVLEVL
jgi:hypothetical protein